MVGIHLLVLATQGEELLLFALLPSLPLVFGRLWFHDNILQTRRASMTLIPQ